MTGEPFDQLLEAIAAPHPDPAGGAVAGLNASLATALVLMVARVCRRKAVDEDARETLARSESRLQRLLEESRPLAEEDAKAYVQVTTAYRIKTEEKRHRALQSAVEAAIAVPLATLELIGQVVEVADEISSFAGKAILGDLVMGTGIASAAAAGCYTNIRINASLLADQDRAKEVIDDSLVILDAIRRREKEIREALEGMLD